MRNATISVPLKYFNIFWRLFEMPLINCKVELELQWKNYCVLPAAGSVNIIDDEDNANNISSIKVLKLYVPVVTL